jgi:hypothetical protein
MPQRRAACVTATTRREHLDELLPARSKQQVVKHHPTMPYDKLPAVMVRLREHKSASARALELTNDGSAHRRDGCSPFRGNGIENAVWTVPAGRMNGQRPHRAEHRVPLVGRALAIAKATPEGYSGHGFRSSFKHPAAECTDFDTWVSEKALAGDETRHTHTSAAICSLSGTSS